MKIRNVHKTYPINGRNVHALRGIDMDVESESFVCIVGKSGCGKSTLLRLICALEDKDEGEITFEGMGRNGHAAKVSIVFQEPRLMPWMSVRKNIEFPIKGKIDGKSAHERVERHLQMLGIKQFENAYPSQISGGMAQRVSLGRTLCYEPDIILMDEPLGALDAFNRKKLQNEIVSIFQREKKTILFVTHDVEEAVLLGQKILVMDDGMIKASIDVEESYPRNPNTEGIIKLKEHILKLIFE